MTEGHFVTSLQDFKYVPYIKDGHIVRKLVVLVNDVVWEDSNGVRYTVPRGFVFNLTSIPVSGILFDKLGRHQRASAPHDWFYANKTKGKLWADRQIKEGASCDQVVWWRRRIISAGLFVGGFVAWYSPGRVLVVDVHTMATIKDEKTYV